MLLLTTCALGIASSRLPALGVSGVGLEPVRYQLSQLRGAKSLLAVATPPPAVVLPIAPPSEREARCLSVVARASSRLRKVPEIGR